MTPADRERLTALAFDTLLDFEGRDALRALLADHAALTALLTEGGEANPWWRTARDMANNAEFYRGLVNQIGEMFGDAAKTADDGSMSDSVLALKVPELVAALTAQVGALREALQSVMQTLGPAPVDCGCEGCQYEMGDALKTIRAVGIEYIHRKKALTRPAQETT